MSIYKIVFHCKYLQMIDDSIKFDVKKCSNNQKPNNNTTTPQQKHRRRQTKPTTIANTERERETHRRRVQILRLLEEFEQMIN